MGNSIDFGSWRRSEAQVRIRQGEVVGAAESVTEEVSETNRGWIRWTLPAIVVVCLIGIWISSHFQMLTIGVELPFGAYGIGIERGSVMAVQGTDTGASFRPFFEFLAYESYLGLPPEILDTIKGTFAFGEHPRFPWLVGVAVPCWFLVLGVVAVGVATPLLRRRRLKEEDSPEE